MYACAVRYSCYFVLFFAHVICVYVCVLVSTNRLIKLITDWTIRKKMMEWIEHKLSNGWKAIDWINTNEQHEHKHIYTRLHTAAAARVRAKRKLKSLCSPIAIISLQMKRCIHYYCVCVVCVVCVQVSFANIQPSLSWVFCICLALYVYIHIYNISIVCGPFTKHYSRVHVSSASQFPFNSGHCSLFSWRVQNKAKID